MTDEGWDNFLKDVAPVPLTEEERKSMERDLTVEKVGQVLGSLQSGEPADSNRLPVELYKGLRSKLAPHLTAMYHEALKIQQLPINQTTATVVVIHKEGKPATECASCRPISLLNVEAKALAKVLATRLQTVITSIVQPDQLALIPRRSTRLNICRLYGVLHMTESQGGTQAALMALDAKTAFNSMEWRYMFATLRKLGCGLRFCAWIKLLYQKPLARGGTPSLLPRPIILVVPNGFKYLGIYITRDPQEFLWYNLAPQLEWLERDVEHWRQLPLTLMGRVALYKMMTMPGYYMCFQNTMVAIPMGVLQKIDQTLRFLI
ncbi:hypothetical protein NDU88_000232 [Pleurodeles waltl]|uniref:Reverse transcriptase domain-containing protein n=1 Tax=Pleurodeles waltl TaxID=8319 RepID=A0AAV7USS8_PLEWA|nr:hypothetical protein NDU88_000232 [Pleurodeles waltl]